MRKAAGDLMQTITPTSLEPVSTTVSSESGFETLCSYNWQHDGKAMHVPGKASPMSKSPCIADEINRGTSEMEPPTATSHTIPRFRSSFQRYEWLLRSKVPLRARIPSNVCNEPKNTA